MLTEMTMIQGLKDVKEQHKKLVEGMDKRQQKQKKQLCNKEYNKIWANGN